MKKNKLLSAVLSAVMSVSAVTGLTANAFGISDNGLPEYITSGKEVEDFDWLFDLNELYDYDNYDAVYCQEPDNKNNIWTFYTVSSRADYIFFAFPEQGNDYCEAVIEEVKNLTEEEFQVYKTVMHFAGEPEYKMQQVTLTFSGGHKPENDKTAQQIHELLKDRTESFEYHSNVNSFNPTYCHYLTAYPLYDNESGRQKEEILRNYVQNSGLNADIIKYSAGDMDFRGVTMETGYDNTLYIVPNDTYSFEEHFNLAKDIYLQTGFRPSTITPEDISDSEIVIDMQNSVKGDANEDGRTSISDAVKILQNLANAEKYPLTAQGAYNADIHNTGDGVTGMDAAEIQKLDSENKL